MRLRVTLLTAMVTMAMIAGAHAAESPAPSLVRLKAGSAELLGAAAAKLRTQPKRVARMAARIAAPSLAARQDVVAVKRGTSVASRANLSCEARPLSVDRVSGDVTPRGTITVRGSCFGPTPGVVEMLGSAFPGGTVQLGVTSWADGAITASIPTISGAPDQAVQIRLSKTSFGLSHSGDRSRPLASNTIVSEPIPMRFVAARETVIVPVGWFSSTSCGDNIGNAFTRNNQDDCNSFVTTDAVSGWGAAFDVHNPAVIGDHIRPSANATGDDLWQARLPSGWLFDRIEFISSSPGTDIAITPTLDNAHVSWHVRWRTEHVVDRYGPREEATYYMVVFATGPLGTAYKAPN